MKHISFFLLWMAFFFGCNGNDRKVGERGTGCRESHDLAISCFQQIDISLDESAFKTKLQECAKSRERVRDGRRQGREKRDHKDAFTSRNRSNENQREQSQKESDNCFTKDTTEERLQCFVELFEKRKNERCSRD